MVAPETCDLFSCGFVSYSTLIPSLVPVSQGSPFVFGIQVSELGHGDVRTKHFATAREREGCPVHGGSLDYVSLLGVPTNGICLAPADDKQMSSSIKISLLEGPVLSQPSANLMSDKHLLGGKAPFYY